MKTLKENNQGFSLIEIIVTILVIALVVSPFLRSFFLAMNINGDARRLQNATVVCQNVIEEFKARTIDDIIEYSDNVYGVEASTEELLIDGKNYTKYVFENWKLTGADGETFYATITMDPTPYTSDGEKYPVNSLTSPEFSSLFGSDAIMLFKQYTDPDNELESYFRAAGELSEAEIATLTPQNVTKATKMLIDCVYDSSTDIYEYVVTLNITYTYNNDKSVLVTKGITKTYSGNEGHSIYLMLPVYDTYSTFLGSVSNVGGVSSYCASDKLAIEYSYTGDADNKPQLGLYIAQQETEHHTSPNISAIIKSENVTVLDNTQTTPTAKGIYSYDNSTSNFKVYTNIQKSDSDAASILEIQGLTYSDKNDNTVLYEITVDVKYDDVDSDVLTSFTSSKED